MKTNIKFTKKITYKVTEINEIRCKISTVFPVGKRVKIQHFYGFGNTFSEAKKDAKQSIFEYKLSKKLYIPASQAAI